MFQPSLDRFAHCPPQLFLTPTVKQTRKEYVMNLPYNTAPPHTMHIDINSCFATLEQQANPLLRGKPIAVGAYTHDYGCILAASKEAKKFGIKTGHRVKDAKAICPNLIVIPPDPNLYRDAHVRFIDTLSEFTPYVYPKSIDEAILDFSWLKISQNAYLRSQNYNIPSVLHSDICDLPSPLKVIAFKIKSRIKECVGEWVTVSIGIAPNRFWAKTGANLIKPDGLVVMTHQTADHIYAQMELLDINGINIKNEARLKNAGIFTPLQFAKSSLQKLTHEVFQSQANGHHWYVRLRGYETDNVEFQTKSIGHSYALQQKTSNIQELERLFMKLCEKTGVRLRRKELQSHGLYFSMNYIDHTYVHHSHKFYSPIFSTWEIFKHIKQMLHDLHTGETVTHIAMGVLNLKSIYPQQESLFEETRKKNKLALALDAVNNRYGTFTIHPATMLDMNGTILDRIAFGKVKDMQYKSIDKS